MYIVHLLLEYPYYKQPAAYKLLQTNSTLASLSRVLAYISYD